MVVFTVALTGARRALRLRRDPGEGQEAPRQAERRERGLGRRDLRDSGASRRGVHRHGGPPRRRRPEGRGAQRRAVRQARGLEARGVRGGRAPAAEAPTGRALRGVRVGLRPQGPGQLPRRVRPQLLLGEPPARRLDGRPARHRGQGGGLLRRRARGHAPQVPVLREEPLLHALPSDMPEGRAWSDWDAPRIRAWASRVGPSCSELVDRVFACYEFDEQGFNAALAVLRLSRRYTPARLERACGMALATGKRSPRYRDVEPVLRSGQDRAPAGEASGDCGYVRGAGFYGEE